MTIGTSRLPRIKQDLSRLRLEGVKLDCESPNFPAQCNGLAAQLDAASAHLRDLAKEAST